MEERQTTGDAGMKCDRCGRISQILYNGLCGSCVSTPYMGIPYHGGWNIPVKSTDDKMLEKMDKLINALQDIGKQLKFIVRKIQ